jgi:hypothetical protein
MSDDERIRAEALSREMFLRDQISCVEEAREEGIERGRRERDAEFRQAVAAAGLSNDLITRIFDHFGK